MSPAPHLAEGANEQNCFSGHRTPAKPPHIFPAGADADPAGAGVEAEGFGVGGGCELTTPEGVNTGSPLELGAASPVPVGAALATGGPSAGGLGCDEQLVSTIGDRNATHTSALMGLLMRHP